VAERLARPIDLDADGLIVIAAGIPKGSVAGLDNRWATVTLGGERSMVIGHGACGAGFLAGLELEAVDGNGADDVALALTLPCWTLLGMLDRAIELTVTHIRLRKQFGQPLSAFEGVQFQLTDAEVERSGLEMLAKYTLWRIATASADALQDVLALRLPPSRPPTSSSVSATSCTARSASVTKPRCHGCRDTASRCGGYRLECRLRGTN
jgi:alkylation response protein AidB-like acyl-CoA dehydrogenase